MVRRKNGRGRLSQMEIGLCPWERQGRTPILTLMSRPPHVSIHIRSEAPFGRVGAQDIVRSVKLALERGELVGGMRLPPVRALEHQLGISKNTVQSAYDELVARGLCEARAREGVYIAMREEGTAPMKSPLSAKAAGLIPPALPRFERVGKDAIELSTVFIDPELLPLGQLSECFRSVLSAPGIFPFYDAQGYRPLRAAIAERLRARGMDVDEGSVILTAGSQQGIDMVARALQKKTIAAEDPVYANARLLFEGVGAEVVGLRLDPFESVPLDEWAEVFAARRPSLLYTITSYQNPTGYSYSTWELVQLLEMSQHYGFALLEDDWGSDMLSCSEYRPTLRALGGPDVLYLNSFTKKLLPSLRLGFLAASEETKESLIAQKRLSTLGNAQILEAVLFEFIDRGYYDTHLSRVQAALDARYHACLASLRELMPEGVRWSTPGGGPTLWVELPRSVDLPALQDMLKKKGVLIEDAGLHFHGERHLHGFRVGFAYLSPERLREGLTRAAEALSELGATASSPRS